MQMHCLLEYVSLDDYTSEYAEFLADVLTYSKRTRAYIWNVARRTTIQSPRMLCHLALEACRLCKICQTLSLHSEKNPKYKENLKYCEGNFWWKRGEFDALSYVWGVMLHSYVE